MGSTTVKSAGTGIRLTIHVDADQATATFKKARRLIRRDFHNVLLGAAQDTVVPKARVLAGNLKINGQSTAGMIVARKGSFNSVYLTSRTRGKTGRAFGLQELGGHISTPLVSKRKKGAGGHAPAIKTPHGFFFRISGTRTYTGRKFLRHAVDQDLDRMTDLTLKRLMGAFDPLEHTP